MHIVTRSFVLLLMMFSLLSCKKIFDSEPEQLPSHIVKGKSYYTQFVLQYEKGHHLTTNYRRGTVLPINSKVKLLDITPKTIQFEIENGTQPLLIKNAKKHTGDDVYQAFDKLVATEKVNLANFNSLERKHIEAGTATVGMRKKAVTVAIGYPPSTETVNLDANSWVYWSMRFNKFQVNFKNDKVTDIVD